MVENRCPMCGKPNPVDQDVCLYCQARLTPLIASDSTGESSEDKDQQAGLPEWINQGWNEEEEDQDQSLFNDKSEAQAWLDRLRADSENESVDAQTDEAGSSEGEEMPADGDDWLQRIRALHSSGQEPEPIDGSDQPEMESRPFLYSESEESSEKVESEELPDWLRRLDAEDTGQPEKDKGSRKELPEWLSAGIDSLGDEVFEPPQAAGVVEASPEMPGAEDNAQDWLSRLDTDRDLDEVLSGDLTHKKPLDQGPDADQALPDWLLGGDLGQVVDVSQSIGEPELSDVFGEEEGELPAWLSDFRSKRDDEEDQTEGDVRSEWDFEGLPGENKEEPVSETVEGEIPEWLSSLGHLETTPEDLVSGISEEDASTESEDLQAWFSELDKAETLADERQEGEAAQAEEEIPGWLVNLGSVVTGTVEDGGEAEESRGGVSPFVGEDFSEGDFLDVESLPDWLSPEAVAGDHDTRGDASLTPADLPGWLEAMRPVEGAQREALDDNLVESAGPLAGLRGILPAEPDVTQFKKPSTYSARLKITETQQSQVEVIQSLLAAEGKAKPVPEPPLLSTQRALRWVIAFLLVIGVSFVVLGGSQVTPYPGINTIPDGTLAVSRIISAIPDQAPVLLVFDYEPGTSGEMHATAAALVDHLMLRGARLALVSTLPTGPGMGEYFIHEILPEHDYDSGEQYINLGYIPGGTAGLLSFAQTPKWVIQYSYEGVNPWESRPLSDVETLSDFSVLVVITDNFDVARRWIEQVQPRIGNTPLLMVVSAQIEPMIRPYYGDGIGRQVSGMISGVAGGVAYELVLGKGNLGRIYWDAFNVGLAIIVAVIIIGGGINTTQYLLSRSNIKDQEGVG
jgi:hypothetical protein